LELEER